MLREIITRRRLPHWFLPGATFFVTYRLIDSLPAGAMQRLHDRRLQLMQQASPPGTSRTEHRRRRHKQWFAEYDSLLDRQQGACWLSNPPLAAKVRSNLYHHHGTKYYLLAFAILPNHVHVLLQPILPDGQSLVLEEPEHIGEREDSLSPLSSIMHSLKSYTAHENNKLLHRSGAFWQRESYDHWIRDDDELDRIVAYIEANPVKARLAPHPQDWYFCSCHDRYLTDGEASGWLRWE